MEGDGLDVVDRLWLLDTAARMGLGTGARRVVCPSCGDRVSARAGGGAWRCGGCGHVEVPPA